MGRLGWELQKRLPMLSSNAYLKLQFLGRRRSQQAYINYFMESEEPPYPLVVNLETINRCNSDCAFCTANKHAEKRPFQRMEKDLFYHIIDQLRDWGYKGHLTLYGNNEPWMDTNIVEFHKYCREQLPDCYIFMSTNGLLLDVGEDAELLEKCLSIVRGFEPSGICVANVQESLLLQARMICAKRSTRRRKKIPRWKLRTMILKAA